MVSRRAPDPAPLGEGERGFVLIAAIWLLILGGSIVAVLMLRSIGSSQIANAQRHNIMAIAALDSAVETVTADLLFSGNRSQWAALPVRRSFTLGRKSIQVSVTSESGRLDINTADPKLIDAALQGLGIDAAAQTLFVGDVVNRRALKQPVLSLSALRQMLAASGANSTAGLCLEGQLTLFSGLAEPQPGQMEPRLAQALGKSLTASSNGEGAGNFNAGTALRIIATHPDGRALTAIVRVTGLRDEPVGVSAWEYRDACAAG